MNDNNTITIQKKFLNHINNMNISVKSTDCFKNDVFSLGLILLEMARIDIKKLNKSRLYLAKRVNEFLKMQKNEKSLFLNEIVPKMLKWEHETRCDFIELEDELFYKYDLDISKYVKFNPQANYLYFSEKTFEELWDIKCENKMLEQFFKEGWISTKIPNTFKSLLISLIVKNGGNPMLQSSIIQQFNQKCRVYFNNFSWKF